MSRCPECNSKGECLEWCGLSKDSMQDKIEDLEKNLAEVERQRDNYMQMAIDANKKVKVAVNTMTVIKNGYILPNGVLKKIDKALKEIGEEG